MASGTFTSPNGYSIRQVVEGVFASYLGAESALAGVSVYTGDSNDINVLPKAVVLCDTARPMPQLGDPAGNYICSVRITLWSNADDTTLSDHRARCATIVALMRDTSSIQTAFVTDAKAICYDCGITSEDEGVDERSWATAFVYEVWTCLNPA